MSDDVEVSFGADTSGLDSGAQRAASAVQGAASDMAGAGAQTEAAWGGIGQIFEGLGETVKSAMDAATGGVLGFASGSEAAGGRSTTAMVGAGVAIGESFAMIGKNVIEEVAKMAEALLELPSKTSEFLRQMNDMARELGTNAQTAYAFSTATEEVGASSEDAEHAMRMLSMRLKENEGDLNRMGVVTRDTSGALLDQQSVFYNAIDTVNSYREGTDRNAAAVEVFGRSVTGSSRILTMSREAQSDVTAELKAYGDVITTQVVAANNDFIDATNRQNVATKALKDELGEELMPAFTDLKRIMTELIAGAIEPLKLAVGVLLTAFYGLENGVVAVWQTINAVVNTIAVSVIAIAKSLALALQGNFSGAWHALSEGGTGVVGAWQSAGAAIVKSSEETAAKIRAIYSGEGADAAAAPSGGSRGFVAKPKKGPRDDNTVDAEIALLNAKEKAKVELEKEGVKEEEALYDEYYKRGLITAQEYYDRKTQLQQAQIDQEIHALEAHRSAIEAKSQQTDLKQSEMIKLKTEEATIDGQLAVLEMQRKDIAIKNAEAMDDAEKKQRDSLERTRIGEQANTGEQGVALEKIGLEQKKALRQINEAEYIASEQAMENELYQIRLKAAQDEAALDVDNVDKYAQDMAKIEDLGRKHEVTMATLAKDGAVEAGKYGVEYVNSMDSAFTSLLDNLTKGTQTLKQTLTDFGNAVVAAIDKIFAEEMAKNIAAGMTGGGSGILGSIGGLFGSLGKMAGIPSFAVGTNYVPQDTLAMIHKGEAIVPAAQNNGMGGGLNVQFNVTSPDANSFMQSKNDMMVQLFGAMRMAQIRNG